MISLTFYLLFTLAVIVLLARWRHGGHRRPPLPPGPKALPFIGNLHQLPLVDSFRTFAEWGKTYGPLIYFHTMGRQFVVVNDLQSALDLFEKRSIIYCTKPRLVMAGELVGKEKTSMVFAKYGLRHRACRKLVHTWMNKQSLLQFSADIERSSLKLMQALSSNQINFSKHIRTQAGSVLIQLLYGIHCSPENDPLVDLSEYVSGLTAEAMKPGRWLVDIFPALAYIPRWFPGASFRRWALHARRATDELIQGPYLSVREDVMSGSAAPSWVAQELLNDNGEAKSEEDANTLMVSAGSLYAAGIDTSVSTIRTFFLMMARYPDVQRKAWEELDRVVGPERLPVLADRDALPYLNCIIKEVLRMTSVVPLMPHSLDEDDIYRGYLIPKNAWVMVNSWGIFYDERNYPSPFEFRPERFEVGKENGAGTNPDPEVLAFGLGRRTCVGVHFAQAILFLNMAQTLSMFDIRTGEPDGAPPPPTFAAGHVRKPVEFRCNIVPRHTERLVLLTQMTASEP